MLHMTRLLFILITILSVTIQTACKQATTTEGPTNEYDKDQVIREITEKVWEFHSADTARNAQGVIDLLWPDFTMLADGNRTKYDDVVNGSPPFMKSLELFHTEWTDLQIIPISQDAALSSFLFRDSIITKTGELTQKKGPNTFLWERRNNEWKVRYADADHYPVQ